MNRTIQVPISKEDAKSLRAGDYVLLNGTIYTARDAAHKRMYEALAEGKELPLDWKGNVVYYMGPSPAREGRPIGSAGPTTASRMDKYTPQLLDLGLGAMIGKGKRSQAVIDAVVRNGSVYFAAVGGAGALLSQRINFFRFDSAVKKHRQTDITLHIVHHVLEIAKQRIEQPQQKQTDCNRSNRY